MVNFHLFIIKFLGILSHSDGKAIHLRRCTIQNALHIVTHHKLYFPILQIVNRHSKIIVDLAAMNDKWHDLAVLQVKLIGNVLQHTLFDVRQFQIIDMPNDGTLLSINHLVDDAAVIWVDNKTKLLS